MSCLRVDCGHGILTIIRGILKPIRAVSTYVIFSGIAALLSRKSLYMRGIVFSFLVSIYGNHRTYATNPSLPISNLNMKLNCHPWLPLVTMIRQIRTFPVGGGWDSLEVPCMIGSEDFIPDSPFSSPIEAADNGGKKDPD